MTTTRLRKIMLELQRDICSDEQFQELLRKFDNSLISKDNIIAEDSGNIMDSKGSIFIEPELKHKTNNTIEHHIVHEHEALQNLTTKNDYTHQDLIVNMFSPSVGGRGINNPHNLGSGRESGSPSILRTQQIANITPQQIKPELENILLQDINDLLRQANRNTDMTSK